MEKVLNGPCRVSSLMPVLVDFGGTSPSARSVVFVDMANNTVYNHLGEEQPYELTHRVLDFMKVPVIDIPPIVQKSLEQRKNINYTKGQHARKT